MCALVTGVQTCALPICGRLGAVDHARDLTGSPAGPDGDRVPGLIEDLADWSESDIAYALKIGMTPEGDFLRDAMGEVIENSTSHTSDSDLSAIAKYPKGFPAATPPRAPPGRTSAPRPPP